MKLCVTQKGCLPRVYPPHSVCTVKSLQTASKNKIPILVLNSNNVAALLPTIARLPPDLANYFRSIAPFGTITIPDRPTISGN